MGTTGYRPATRAGLAAQRYDLEADRGVSRSELSAAAREACEALELTPSTRIILHELVGVWSEKELSDRLLVWPSNRYLMVKTGLSERTVRYVLRSLIELELIGAKDSANGKRFGIRNAQGQIVDAYGFDLTPLYARRGEFQTILERQKQRRASLKRIFEQMMSCRRAIAEVLQALSESFPEITVADLLADLSDLTIKTPRRPLNADPAAFEPLLSLWMNLRLEAERRFYDAGNGGMDCRHIEPNNGPYSNTCKEVIDDDHAAPAVPPIEARLVVEACPAHKSYYERPIRSVPELIAAAEFLRPVLGAHASAWKEAVDLLGPPAAAAVLFMVLQRYDANPDSMRNPGGYFRAMARTVADRKINLMMELLEMRRKDQRGVSSP